MSEYKEVLDYIMGDVGKNRPDSAKIIRKALRIADALDGEPSNAVCFAMYDPESWGERLDADEAFKAMAKQIIKESENDYTNER